MEDISQVSAKGMELLSEALECWNSCAGFRKDRTRNKRYTYGQQWHDLVEVDGVMMKEEDYIRMQGNVPLKNNLIRRLVRNVVGVFRDNFSLPERNPDLTEGVGDLMIESLEENSRYNRLAEVYARSMEEFLISGMVVHRKWYGRMNGRDGALTEAVSPERFFFDSTMADFRCWDAGFLGEIHDMSFTSLCAAFAEDPADVELLKAAYPGQNEKCRVYEVWKKENVERFRCHDLRGNTIFCVSPDNFEELVLEENKRRKADGERYLIESEWCMEETWRYYFLTSDGRILLRGDTPYSHGEHPFVFKAYPFIDGEIHSFVSDVIDQQRHTNRLVTLYDWVMRSTAKGVLLFPEDCLPDGVEIDDISDEWSRFNGVILFRPRPGMPLPQQVSGNAANLGISELLNLQLKLFEDISGVNSALQGRLDSNSVSGTLFNQQTRNALTSLSDILSTFNDFIAQCTRKDICNISSFSCFSSESRPVSPSVP